MAGSMECKARIRTPGAGHWDMACEIGGVCVSGSGPGWKGGGGGHLAPWV